MNSCELVTFVSAAACSISKCVSREELEVLAAVFTQLGDSISTILAHRSLCSNDDDGDLIAGDE